MKKKLRKERLDALRKAYYAELNKTGVMDSEKKTKTKKNNKKKVNEE